MDEKQLKQAIASLAQDPTKRNTLAELMIEYIQPNHIVNDFIGLLLNTRSLNKGDALVKKIRKGINVRTLVPGSIHLASEVTVTERINYLLDGADVKVTYNEWELETGELGTVDSIRTEMLAKLRDYYQNKVFTALTSIWTASNTPSNYTSVGGQVTETVLKTAIKQIANTVGPVKAIVGVRSLLYPITEFGAFWGTGSDRAEVPSQIEQVMATGWLGRYFGAPVIALDQIWDNPEDYNTLLPTDKVLVIGENVGEWITYGEPRWKQWVDMNPTPPQWFLEVYQQHGMIIDKAQGIYVLGNVTA